MEVKGVAANAKNGRDIHRKSGQWLQDSLEFNQWQRLPLEKKHLLDKFLNELFPGVSHKRKQKILDLDILVSNLLKQNKQPVTVSLSRNEYQISKYYKASYFTIDLINKLQDKGYIEMKKGYYTAKEKRKSRIWASELLSQYFEVLPKHIILEPIELVELKDNKGKLIEYKDTQKTRDTRSILRLVNDVNSKANIRWQKHELQAFLIAIFKQKFTLYGRLHTRGYMHYQGLSGDERGEITINGEATIERDFKALHPNLLYATEGIQYLGDPYGVIHENPITRDFLKRILLFLLNSNDELQAERAANYWLMKMPEYKKELSAIGINSARPLIKLFREAHKPIEHYFCTGKETGLRIMNKDAAIALDIINHFAKQNIPILCIHDSFIVQSRYDAELTEIMKKTYKKHTNFRIVVK